MSPSGKNRNRIVSALMYITIPDLSCEAFEIEPTKIGESILPVISCVLLTDRIANDET
jgi:hypothetical protein